MNQKNNNSKVELSNNQVNLKILIILNKVFWQEKLFCFRKLYSSFDDIMYPDTDHSDCDEKENKGNLYHLVSMKYWLFSEFYFCKLKRLSQSNYVFQVLCD